MTIFTVTITDTAALAGITAARNAYNSSLPVVNDEKDVPIFPTPGTLASDSDYIQMVVAAAADSYAKQFNLVITVADKAKMQNIISSATVKG